jgi:outer membrane protein TolC
MSFTSPVRPTFHQRLAACSIFALLTGTLLPAAAVAQDVSTPPSPEGIAAANRKGGNEPAQSDPSTSQPVLAAIVAIALQDNPEILAAAARLDAAAERPAQAGSLADPVLTGVYRNTGFDSFTLGEEMMSVAGLRFTQPIPYKGKRDLRAATATRGIDVAASRLDLISRRVAREVAETYFELAYVDEAVEIVEDTRDYLINLEQTAEARYAVGEGIQQDVLKAQVEVSVLLNRLVMLEQQHDTAETRLNRLLDRPVATPVGTPAQIPAPSWNFNLDDLQTEAVASSALVRERARQIEQQRAALDVAVSESKPDWILSGAWMNRGGLPDIWEVNVGITLPIYKDTKQDRAVAEAEAAVRASEHDLQDSSSVVAAAVRDQFLRAERASRLLQLYGEAIIPQATLSLESAGAGYEVGRVDFLTVIDNVVTLLTYQLEYYRQYADYMQALTRIEEHIGRSLGVTPAEVFRSAPAQNVQAEGNEIISGGNR